MRWWDRVVAVAAAGAVAAGIQACTGGCADEDIDRAVAFINAHQTCSVDADCAVISDYCEELPGGYCGQLSMNREGAESSEWMALSRELSDCSSESCSVCGAALLPTCTNGACGPKLTER